MFKNWIIGFVIVSASVSPLAALYGAETLELGAQIVQRIDADYKNGKHTAFLAEVHTHFERAGKAGVLRGIFHSTRNAVQPPSSGRDKAARADKERNQRLLQAVSAARDLEISRRVDTVVFACITDEQEETLAELEALKLHIPKMSESTFENKLSALETEYYIKALLLEIGAHVAKGEVRDLETKKTVLQLAKFDRMLEAANGCGEKKWVEKLEGAKAAYRSKRAFSIDYAVLKDLGREGGTPQNPIEEKVKEIMIDYLNSPESTQS